MVGPVLVGPHQTPPEKGQQTHQAQCVAAEAYIALEAVVGLLGGQHDVWKRHSWRKVRHLCSFWLCNMAAPQLSCNLM